MDELLSIAGVTRDEFFGIKRVERSEFSGRIIVVAAPSITRHPIENRSPSNLWSVAHLDGETHFIFNPVS